MSLQEGSFDAWLAGRSSNFRGQMRRLRRRFVEAGGSSRLATPATLATDASIDTWRQWHWTWDAPRGSHVLQVRATDDKGNAQIESSAPPVPNGATGLHTVNVKVG